MPTAPHFPPQPGRGGPPKTPGPAKGGGEKRAHGPRSQTRRGLAAGEGGGRDAHEQRKPAAFDSEINQPLAFRDAVVQKFAGGAKQADSLDTPSREEIQQFEQTGKIGILRIFALRSDRGGE